jgi:hypothetical protein
MRVSSKKLLSLLVERLGTIGPTLAVTAFVAFLAFPSFAQSDDSCSNRETYENRNQIDYGPLKVSRVNGLAADPTGTSVSRACVFLFTEQGHDLVSKTETDDRGRFSFVGTAKGRYRLLVKANGFCTANIPILVRRWARSRRLVVHMGVSLIDGCGSFGSFR